jgi:ABC-type Zn uptake system ZnuABC Zn-binding protein ZnuA
MKLQSILLSVGLMVLLMTGCVAPVVPGAAEPATATEEPGPETVETPRLNVVTTVAPIANIIYNMGGDRINLVGIVPEGVNSHTFEPAPSDARVLAQADLIFVNGLDLEEPTIRLAEANLKDGAEIIYLGEQTVSPEEYVFDFSFPVEEGSPNPHLWMNPFYALRYAELAVEAMSERDPVNADYFQANYELFAERIQALDAAIAEAIATIPEDNRRLLTYHDSFAYFAPRYGVTVIGAIQPSDFSEPSAREVANLITQIRDEQIPAIFGSEVFPSPVLDQIARESGVEFVDTLSDDDLPGEPGDANHSYLGMMVENVVTMTSVLGGDPAAIEGFDATNIP